MRENIVADASAGPARYQLARQDATASTDDSSSPSVELAMLTENKQGSPLVIHTAGPEPYMEMPVRPGDVLFVPAEQQLGVARNSGSRSAGQRSAQSAAAAGAP